MEITYSTTKLMAILLGVGLEPTRLASYPLKGHALTNSAIPAPQTPFCKAYRLQFCSNTRGNSLQEFEKNIELPSFSKKKYTDNGARTHDHQVKSLTLYQLSYDGSHIRPFSGRFAFNFFQTRRDIAR